MKFEIRAVRDVDLMDVAEFLHRWHQNREDLASSRAVPRTSTSIEQCLRWLLVENPVQDGAPHYGFYARDDSGVIRGLTLNFPNAFVVADRRVVGLCSGSFYVEPQVRTAGFYLFKRYLDSTGHSFYFATTCNAKSSAIWQKLGGAAVPSSEMEYILPFRFDIMLPVFLARKSGNTVANRMARALGESANLLSRFLPRRSAALAVERCRDWDKLSDLSRSHMLPGLITNERSAPFLQWRYGSTSPNHLADICVFRDSRGCEGWFALGERMLGRDGHVRAGVVLDVMWPRTSMDFREVLRAIVQRASEWADAVFFPPRPGINYREYSALIVPRTHEAPRVWAIASKGSTSLDWSCLDLVTADGDSGWSNRFENEVARTDHAA